MAQRSAHLAAHQLQVGEQQGRLLSTVRRPEDRVRPAGQHDQDLGQDDVTVDQGADWAHGFRPVPAVRRQGDHQRLQRFHGQSLEREHR